VDGQSLHSALRAHIDPGRVAESGALYEQTLRIWNGAVRHRPSVVVRPVTPEEVRTAVLVARDCGAPLSVRGGGHDWAGRALRDCGLVIDMTAMDQLYVDPVERVATAGGGVTSAQAAAAARPHELAPVTGNFGTVGLTGFTLAGGYGPLGGVAGLGLDNVLAAEVVLPDGRLVVTDADREPELFWALRGGGGNFGAVTSLRLRLHPVHPVLGGPVVFPWSQAAGVLARLRDFLATAPDELTVQTVIATGPDGDRLLIVVPAWSGDPEAGEKVLGDMQRLGRPLDSQVAARSYPALLGLFDDQVPDGRHYEIRTRSVPAFTPEVVSALIETTTEPTSPYTVLPTSHFHGAATRVPQGETSFGGPRRYHHLLAIVAGWDPHDPDPQRHRDWAGSVSDAVAPYALPGGYPNLLAPDDRAQTAQAYGENAGRLLAAKARFDPDGVFTATPLPDEAAAETV